MTSRLIGSRPPHNRPSSPIWAKGEWCKSSDIFSCWIKDCSATRIPSSSITGRHPRPTGSLMAGGVPFVEVQSVFYSSSRQGVLDIAYTYKLWLLEPHVRWNVFPGVNGYKKNLFESIWRACWYTSEMNMLVYINFLVLNVTYIRTHTPENKLLINSMAYQLYTRRDEKQTRSKK